MREMVEVLEVGRREEEIALKEVTDEEGNR
jgi:hypothetical protein